MKSNLTRKERKWNRSILYFSSSTNKAHLCYDSGIAVRWSLDQNYHPWIPVIVQSASFPQYQSHQHHLIQRKTNQYDRAFHRVETAFAYNVERYKWLQAGASRRQLFPIRVHSPPPLALSEFRREPAFFFHDSHALNVSFPAKRATTPRKRYSARLVKFSLTAARKEELLFKSRICKSPLNVRTTLRKSGRKRCICEYVILWIKIETMEMTNEIYFKNVYIFDEE